MRTPSRHTRTRPGKIQPDAQKELLEADVKLRDRTPQADSLTELESAIERLPLLEEEKEILLAFDTRPQQVDIVEHLKLQDKLAKVWRSLSELKERGDEIEAISSYFSLRNSLRAEAMGAVLGAAGWDHSMAILRARWETKGDINALAAALAGIDAAAGKPIEDPAEITEEWVSKAILKVARG